jgi:hypothetical protein
MQTKNIARTEVREKILKGLDLVSKRLVEKARKENLELIVFRDNKIQKIRFSK